MTMKRALFLVAGVGLAATLLAPATALAQRRSDWYYDVRPYVGRQSESTVRKARLWEETVRLRSAVRSADRRGNITARETDRFYDRIDRVARFLRDDRNLTNSEFDRRRDDLNGIARDLHRERRDGRRDDRRRYDDDRYGRRVGGDRYARRGADICDICGGACRYR